MGKDQVGTTCAAMLDELQLIWDEIVEGDEERDQALLQLEQECLDVYRRKVAEVNCMRASLHQKLADIHSEIAKISSELGETPPLVDKRGASLKGQLACLVPLMQDLMRQKEDRLKLFIDVRSQIQGIKSAISSSPQSFNKAPRNEQDLTLQKLEELHAQLQILQKEKNERLFKVVDYMDAVHDLCLVLGLNFFETVRQVHPSLDESLGNQEKSISNETIERLSSTILSLREEKRRRMQQMQELGTSLVELWNLMDTPEDAQRHFQHVTCNIAATEDEVVMAGILSIEVIQQAAAEVDRLEKFKSSKMKELILKKRTELEEIRRKAHIILDDSAELDRAIVLMESGMIDPLKLLASIEEQIGNTKEEAYSRKEIMDKLEKWVAACEEESWLEEYNKDDNRYSATKGAHLNLKSAERARATVNKMPSLVDSLIMKTKAWEEERNQPFLYDGVRLLSTLEEYNILRIEKEEEKRRHRDQKRLHDQLVTEQETLFGTRPSPNGRTPSVKKAMAGSRLSGVNTPASSRRVSLAGVMLQQPSPSIPKMITPGKHVVTPAAKDSRAKVVMPTPSSVGRMLLADDDYRPISGTKGCSHPINVPVATIMQETDAEMPHRLPLSPVDVTVIQTHKNIDEMQSKSHTLSSTPGKQPSFTTVKSPYSVASPFTCPIPAPTARVAMDDENAAVNSFQRPSTALLKEEHGTVGPQIVSSFRCPVPAARVAVDDENAAVNLFQRPPTALLKEEHDNIQPQILSTQQHQARDYSFEERRLAFFLHYYESQMGRWR